MRSASHISGKVTAGVFLTVFLAGQIPSASAAACQSDSPARDLGKTRSMAETQHEIVMLLLRKKDYSQAESEANKIFDMKWPADQERLLLKELLYLSDQFLHQGQAIIGVRLLDASTKAFKEIPSHISILKEKGYLYKSMNQNDKALECFREAQNLEKKLPG